MGLFNHFPYVNFHELNLDWLLEKVKTLETNVSSLIELIDPEDLYIIHAHVGSSSGDIDETFSDIKNAILGNKRIVIKAQAIGTATYNDKLLYPDIQFLGSLDSTTAISFRWPFYYDYNGSIYIRVYTFTKNNDDSTLMTKHETAV